jgi:hypothetical protein
MNAAHTIALREAGGLFLFTGLTLSAGLRKHRVGRRDLTATTNQLTETSSKRWNRGRPRREPSRSSARLTSQVSMEEIEAIAKELT